MIYTGCYAKVRFHRGECLSVANSAPLSWKYKTVLKSFKPPWWLVDRWQKNKITWDEYKDEYIKHLEHVDTSKDISYIKQVLDDGGNVTLICWEHKPTFCHRKLLAEWLRDKKGFEVLDKNIK